MKLRESDRPKLRKCLKCNQDFMSEWSGNRSCPECLRRNPNHNRHVSAESHVNSKLSETGRHVGNNRIYGG